jgi:hypothetical protein
VDVHGCVNVVLVKSDAAALGVHGIAVQRVGSKGRSSWRTDVFAEPQGLPTRHAVMRMVGDALRECLDEGALALHVVVPDRPTADLLVSMADSLAGVELSRLRWARDAQMERPILSFDGRPAEPPDALDAYSRLAVSFFLEEDRARAMSLRHPVVILQRTLNEHLVAGGPATDSGRLDYLVTWAGATEPLNHRAVTDSIAKSPDTPGARLSNELSDKIHSAHRGRSDDPKSYRELVEGALEYRMAMFDAACEVLAALAVSAMRPVYRALEIEAQTVWRRRLDLQASDLVRFSRTYPRWRDDQVTMLEADLLCARQLDAVVDADAARDAAVDAGTRELVLAHVLSVNPIRLEVESRRVGAGTGVVALHVDGRPLIEEASAEIRIQGGSFKLRNMPVGPLIDDGEKGWRWGPSIVPQLKLGDEIVLASQAWFGKPLTSGHEFNINRPKLDTNTAPKPTCTATSYADDPVNHRWCCRPHTASEAEWSDEIAVRRARNELNPETWPPVIDEDRFDVAADETQTPAESTPPSELTLDDLE